MEYSAVSTIWIMVGTVLIFFMQAGFAMLETGMTRVKNAGNIAMKNLVDFGDVLVDRIRNYVWRRRSCTG